ncbi:hypothetical protein [Actinomycetospora chiangmaiensis]|uniref:hypothetical protein n=1 Tax=Actinomycetospora chiangmaiensis TaxID=402650 RepID=UPI0003A9BE78|nr:hypothetical protein [Actinomycetospora chiangmaiensis]
MTRPAARTPSRRRVLAGLGLGVPALLLAAACSDATAAPVPGVRLHTDWTRRPAGTVPVLGDDGLAFRLAQEGGAPPPAVVGNALRAAMPDRTSSSSLTQEMRSPVRRLGATVAFGPGTEAGAFVLAAWTGVPAVHASCHLVLTPRQWLYGVIENQEALRVIAQDTFPTPVLPDTPVTVDVTLAGRVATLRLPGASATVDDPRIASTVATAPSWGFYRSGPGGADVALLQSWAG